MPAETDRILQVRALSDRVIRTLEDYSARKDSMLRMSSEDDVQIKRFISTVRKVAGNLNVASENTVAALSEMFVTIDTAVVAVADVPETASLLGVIRAYDFVLTNHSLLY